MFSFLRKAILICVFVCGVLMSFTARLDAADIKTKVNALLDLTEPDSLWAQVMKFNPAAFILLENKALDPAKEKEIKSYVEAVYTAQLARNFVVAEFVVNFNAQYYQQCYDFWQSALGKKIAAMEDGQKIDPGSPEGRAYINSLAPERKALLDRFLFLLTTA